MANYENIKPYADFAHMASLNGGIDSYLDNMTAASYDHGFSEGTLRGRIDTIKMAPFVILGGIAICEFVQKKLCNQKEHKERNLKKIESARTAIKEKFEKNVEMAESDL